MRSRAARLKLLAYIFGGALLQLPSRNAFFIRSVLTSFVRTFLNEIRVRSFFKSSEAGSHFMWWIQLRPVFLSFPQLRRANLPPFHENSVLFAFPPDFGAHFFLRFFCLDQNENLFVQGLCYGTENVYFAKHIGPESVTWCLPFFYLALFLLTFVESRQHNNRYATLLFPPRVEFNHPRLSPLRIHPSNYSMCRGKYYSKGGRGCKIAALGLLRYLSLQMSHRLVLWKSHPLVPFLNLSIPPLPKYAIAASAIVASCNAATPLNISNLFCTSS